MRTLRDGGVAVRRVRRRARLSPARRGRAAGMATRRAVARGGAGRCTALKGDGGICSRTKASIRWWSARSRSNQNLRVAAARLDQARDQVTVAASALYPWVGLSADAGRGKISANRPLASYSMPNASTTQNDFIVGPTVNYEVDLFGRCGARCEGARAIRPAGGSGFREHASAVDGAARDGLFQFARSSTPRSTWCAAAWNCSAKRSGFITARHDLGVRDGSGLGAAAGTARVERDAT